MTIEFIWQLPTAGDGRYGNAETQRRGERVSSNHPYSPGVTDPRGEKYNYLDYLHQVARAADLAGFDGLRIPDSPEGDEPWIVAGYVARGTRHLKLLTEFEASRGSSVYAAKNAVSFQRFTGGRFAWQIKTSENESARKALGDSIAESDQVARTEEFITVARGVITQSPFSFKGRFFEVLGGGFQGALGDQKVPPIYLSGNSNEALELSAKFADVHVFDAASVSVLEKAIAALNERAKDYKHQPVYGLRIDVVARETEKEAIFEARRYAQQSQEKPGAGDPLVSRNLWLGLTGGTQGASGTLVGSYVQVADALVEYAQAGIGSFLLSAIPHFEEAYRLGEYVLPLVRAKISPGHRRAA